MTTLKRRKGNAVSLCDQHFLLLSICFCGLASHMDGFALASWTCFTYPSILSITGILLAASLVILAARTTMVAWITVLVLLACSGKRRHSLVLDGKKITIDVALQFVEFLISERSRIVISAVCATVLNVLAKVGIRDACKV